MGMALDAPGDCVTAAISDTPGIHLTILGPASRLPTDPDRNTAGIAARETLVLVQRTTGHAIPGVQLWLEKGLPLASGLGSSAASAVAAAVAVNDLLGAPLSVEDLLPACIEAEAAISGRHADNVAPALLGGIVLVTGIGRQAIHRLPVPDHIYLALVTPDFPVPTAQARAVLPSQVPLRTLVSQTAHVAALVHALHTNDLALLANAIQQDNVITPARTPLIPGIDQARQAACKAGALATIISGAGPTLCSLCDSPHTAQAVVHSFEEVYASLDMAAVARIARPSPQGAIAVH